MKGADLAGLSKEQLSYMFTDHWSRRKRSMPFLPGINYGSFNHDADDSFDGRTSFLRNGIPFNIYEILSEGFVGK